MISAKVKLISLLTILSMTFLCCSAIGDTSIENSIEEEEEASIHSERVITNLVNSFKTMAQIDTLNATPEDKLVVQILMSAILQRIARMIQEQQMASIEHLRQDQF